MRGQRGGVRWGPRQTPCARPGCENLARVKYCCRQCSGFASTAVDRATRLRGAQASAKTRRKRTLRAAIQRSGVLLAESLDALSARDQARVLVLVARAYRKGYTTGYQTGWKKQRRQEAA